VNPKSKKTEKKRARAKMGMHEQRDVQQDKTALFWLLPSLSLSLSLTFDNNLNNAFLPFLSRTTHTR